VEAARSRYSAHAMRPAVAASSLVAVAVVAGGAARAAESAQNATILGPLNTLLAEGAAALEAGRFEEGIRLTLEGLQTPSSVRDRAAGHANLCAGYAALKRWDEALDHCNRSIVLDRGNWRAFNNRAAVYVGKGRYDEALADVRTGLELAPQSRTLKESLNVVQQHIRVVRERGRRPPGA